MAQEHIDRKTLKEDAFRNTMFDFADLAYRHRARIAIGAAIMLAIGAGIGGYYLFARHRATLLSERFYAAEQVLADPKASDEVHNAEARKAFQAIADDFTRSRQGAVALVYVARLAWDARDLVAAEGAFKGVLQHSGADATLKGIATLGLATLNEQQGKLAEAEILYNALPDQPFQDLKAVSLGRLALARNNPAEARKQFEEAGKRFPPNSLTEWVKTVLSYIP